MIVATLLLTLLAPAPTVARAPAPTTIIEGGELHVGDGTVVKNSVIVLQGGKIAGIGTDLAPRSGDVVRVDARGKLVTPGLVAADSQLGLVEIDLEGGTHDDARAGDHPIRAAYDASRAINLDSSLIPVQAIGGVTTAAVAPNGGLLSGQVAWLDLVSGDHRGALVAAGVAVAGSLGHSYGGSRAATLAKLREVLTDARLYPSRKAAWERAQSRPFSAHPLDLDALQPALAGKAPLTLAADRTSDILAALDLAREFKFKLVIIGGAEAWKVAPELASAGVTVVLQPTRNLPGSFDTMGARLDTAALLAAAGVPVVIGWLDDSHNLRNLTQEAGIAVANGLPWETALRAITLEPARAYGMSATHGSVAVGKVANLVVWDGDPFELKHHPVQVFIRGRAIPMTSRQTLLRDRYRELPRKKPAASAPAPAPAPQK